MEKKLADMYVRSLVNKSATGMNEATAADGGAAIGVEIAEGIYGRMVSTSSILSSAAIIPMTKGSTIKVPYINDYLSVDEREDGVRAYWIDEAGEKTISTPVLGSAQMELGKLVVRIPYTDELFNDRPDLVEWLTVAASDAIRNKLEYGMIYNDLGAVLGVAGGGDGEKATVKSGFSAVPSEAQLIAAYKLLNPLAVAGARWYVSQATYADLSAATYDVLNREEEGQMYIVGLPVEVCPWLNADLHIVLANFAGYGLAAKQAKVMVSDQLNFDTDQSEFRMVYRVAGKPITEVQEIDSTDVGYFVIPDPNIS